MTRIKRDAIAYSLIIAFCILMLAWAIPVYTPAYPGYGASSALVPIVAVSVMLFMAVLSLITIGISVYRKKSLPITESEFPEDLADAEGFTQVGRISLSHLARVMIPSVTYVVLIEYIGYLLAAPIFLMAFQYLIGNRAWFQMVIVSAMLTAALYIVMRYGFGVPVPGAQLFE